MRISVCLLAYLKGFFHCSSQLFGWLSSHFTAHHLTCLTKNSKTISKLTSDIYNIASVLTLVCGFGKLQLLVFCRCKIYTEKKIAYLKKLWGINGLSANLPQRTSLLKVEDPTLSHAILKKKNTWGCLCITKYQMAALYIGKGALVSAKQENIFTLCTVSGAAPLGGVSPCSLQSVSIRPANFVYRPIGGPLWTGLRCCGGRLLGGKLRFICARKIGWVSTPLTSNARWASYG